MAVQDERVESWRDEMSSSKYPFDDSAVLSVPGLTVPDELVVDASFYPPFDGVGLYSISVSGGSATFAFSSLDSTRYLTSTVFSDTEIADVFSGSEIYGCLVFGDSIGEILPAWTDGFYKFDPKKSRIVPSAIRGTPTSGLGGFSDGSSTTPGDLWLIADDGVAIRPEGGGDIRIDVIGDPLFKRRRCEPLDAFVTPNFLKSINGYPPNDYGGFSVTTDGGDTILRIYPDGGAVKIELAGAKT